MMDAIFEPTTRGDMTAVRPEELGGVSRRGLGDRGGGGHAQMGRLSSETRQMRLP